jgi:hypothetical protein
MITRLIETSLLYFLIPLYLIMILFFYRYWSRITDVIGSYWLDISDLDGYSSMIIVLKAEMKLIFVYVLGWRIRSQSFDRLINIANIELHFKESNYIF